MEATSKKIIGFENYSVDILGNIKNLNTNKTLKLYLNHNGYLRCRLSKNNEVKNFMVHRLVAMAFPEICGEYFEGAQVNHKNEIKTDNRAENLEWCTAEYNTNYGTGIKKRSTKHFKPILQFSKKGEFIKEWKSFKEAEKELNIKHSNISKCCNNERKTTGGYIWKYKSEE